ncbi:kinesin-like protein KIF15 isoform X1 [Nylanderia fulva]|uniref:kinesin-like protein KIF15 isoform X1 n=1 Tax=Nylanderia fulva TaxID=613905 RepID=UPI0010FAEAC8|nr:kinesin-like protein KIF15 isoform X1 [Nylanderia fulva]XP_029160724.1 kinesin-like protein KIF15 isoform X1 [Nylanderia fulva]
MHSMYSSKKGDPLCPLGFHPQVRWPTRCKRCFRDYKEHGGRRNSLGDITSSSPSLSFDSSRGPEGKRTWSSATNLAKDETKTNNSQSAASTGWTSLMDLSAIDKDAQDPKLENVRKPAKLQIKNVISNTNGGTSENDVEFIIQVRKSRPAPPKQVVEDGLDNVTVKGEESEKNEIEKLKSQLNAMRARCEKAEKEKSEILLRRLATMDTMSNKTSMSEVAKLQKKNEVLAQEKNLLLTKIKSLEKETSNRPYRGEKDKVHDELRSKLKAAESLCESLMDENEDMKKEIRQLEEEIYELQDNFRDEQADEYTRLRKSLEQSNKNCRILSFKLRKVERKSEELESERVALEKKYEEMKKTEEILQKVSNAFQERTQKKATDSTTRIQLKKMVDEMEKEIEDMLNIFSNIKNGHNVDISDLKPKDNNLKYDKLLKEHELLKEKLESTIKELTSEKEKKKVQSNVKVEDTKNVELQNVKKKLEEAVTLRETERKAWDKEKLALSEEKEKLKSKLLSLSAEKLKIYNEVVQLKKDFETAKSSEKDTAKMEEIINELKEKLSQEQEKCKRLQDDLSSYTERESKMSQSITSVEQTKTKLDAEVKRLKKELESSKSSTSKKITDLNVEIAALKQESEKLTSQLNNEKEAKENEIATLKKKIASLEKAGQNTKRMNELKETYNEKILNLENDIKKQQQDQETLTNKYQELMNSKLQLERENESLNSKSSEYKTDLKNIQTELDELRNSMKTKENDWRLEKSVLESQIRENQLPNKLIVAELNDEINTLKKESSTLLERLEDMKKVNDDLSTKLKDYEAVSKIHQVLTPDTTALESEIRKLKNALTNTEKAKKADLAQCKMRYEHRITAINDEIQAIQNQLSRYKRERDTYKHMLEGAQKTIGELKSARGRLSNASSGKSDEDEESSKANVLVLEKQISCMEDELSETRLEASRLKAELVSEKSGSHVKVSELQSRINELEEERLLTSGRSKIPGLKVRMELAWQKEREEHQRLLQETATLARDLRQTLFEIERERNKERLENKRRQDQLKKVFDEEKEENKKKLLELQCDLLELRDAHAKLRTSNEKMRREKERHEKERHELKEVILNKCKLEQTELRNINILMQQVQDLLQLFPELNTITENGMSDTFTPTPPRRLKGPKSRESSPMLETKSDIKVETSILGERTEKLEYTIKKLMGVAKELKESKKMTDEANATRLKKMGKRSTSVESDPGKGVVLNRSKPRLKRKSLSLEQTSGRQESPAIWGNDSNLSSMQSLEGSEIESRGASLQRDSSVDSRLSGGSTKSEMLDRDKKYGKGIIRKLTHKLTKSSSVDDPHMTDYSLQTSGSETSLNESSKMEKKNLKKKLTAMFKRGSRSSSVETKTRSGTSSRPASRNSMTSD